MNRIKMILLLFATLLLAGCDLDDDGERFSFERVPIESVDIPDQFVRGEIVKITVFYYRPTDCHSFSGFRYEPNDNERKITVINVVLVDRQCNELERIDLIENSLDFSVGEEDSYLFRFWQGFNDEGNEQFLDIEVPVAEPTND